MIFHFPDPLGEYLSINSGKGRKMKWNEMKCIEVSYYTLVSFQASHQLARNVELRLHGCKLLAKVKPIDEGDSEKHEVLQSVPSEEHKRSSKKGKTYLKPNTQNISHSLIEEHKATITVGVIMGVFLLCWGPFFISNIVSGFCKVNYLSYRI